MNKYLKKIQICFLAITLALTMINVNVPNTVSAAGGVVFEDDFEGKSGWEDLALKYPYWGSSNGGGVSVSSDGLPDNGNCVVINKHTGSSLVAKPQNSLVGNVDISFDMMMNGRSVDGIYLCDQNGNMNGNEWLLRVEWEQGSGTYGLFPYKVGSWNAQKMYTLRQNQWINVRMSFDVDNQKYSIWIAEEGKEPVKVISEMSVLPENRLYGIAFFYPDYNGAGVGESQIGDFKMDNFKMSQLVLNTGVDEDFNSYDSIDDLPGDWTIDNPENVSIVDGKLKLISDATVENIHKPYAADSLMVRGDLQYSEDASAGDSLKVSVVSGKTVVSILYVQADGKINGQPMEGLTAGENFHFDATVDKGKYTVSIDGKPTVEGTFAQDISAGITGLIIQTSGEAAWSIDNLKTMPALSHEQMEEIQQDLAAVEIEKPAPGVVLNLPTKGQNGCEITWECNPESVINVQTGEVNYPDWELGPTDVVLTCKVTKYAMTLSKNFTYHMEPAINNLFVNGDFEQLDEDGRPKGWFSTSSRPLEASDMAQHGNKSTLVSGRGDSIHSGAQYISLKPNRKYHFSGYVKLADETVEGQDGRISAWIQGGRINSDAGDNTNYAASVSAFYMNTDDWINIHSDFDTYVTPQEWPNTAYIFPFPVGSTTLSFYMDNFEIYEYVLKSLSIKGDDVLEAPSKGETVKKFRADAVNQYGNKTGMENLEFEWSIDEPVKGVSINSNGELTVSEYAENQTIQLTCKAKEGTVAGSTWISATKSVSIKNNISDKPKVHNLTVSGSVTAGKTIKAEYEYFQKDGIAEGESDIKWYMSDSYDGTYDEIKDKNGFELYIDENLAEKFIKFSVIPKTSTGVSGDNVFGPIITKSREPIAGGVSIEGNAIVGKKITGVYTFIDYNGDEEGDSIYSWLIADDAESDTFSVIEGANEKELAVTEDMEDKFIKFRVVPVSKNAPESGEAVQSAPLAGPAKPEVKNVKISGRASSGSVLSVEYTYYDKNNDAENNSIIKWYSGDTLLQESATYTPTKADEGKRITAEVTPVSENYPFKGTPVKSEPVTISKSGGGYSVGGGGSKGSGSGSTVSAPSEPVIDHITPSKEPVTFDDITSHWAKQDIIELTKLGIIKGKSDTAFAPNDNITRAEFLACIMRSLNVETVPYSGAFSDVSSADWYADTVQTALKYGIISEAERFNPNVYVTREGIAKMAARAYMYMMNNQWQWDCDLSAFSDHEQISDWAIGYVSGCVSLGLIQGYSDGTIKPSANATRAQAAVIMNRLINLIY